MSLLILCSLGVWSVSKLLSRSILFSFFFQRLKDSLQSFELSLFSFLILFNQRLKDSVLFSPLSLSSLLKPWFLDRLETQRRFSVF